LVLQHIFVLVLENRTFWVFSVKRAFRLIEGATGAGAWAEIAAKRAQDLLIYIALARFDRRRSFGQRPLALQRDIKAFFQSYAQACKLADNPALLGR
jgi:hypothetical protein